MLLSATSSFKTKDNPIAATPAPIIVALLIHAFALTHFFSTTNEGINA